MRYTYLAFKFYSASFRSRFLNLYYSKYNRPLKDYLVGSIENSAPFLSKVGKIVNPLVKTKFISYLIKKLFGYVDTPLLSTPTLKQLVDNKYLYDEATVLSMTDSQKQNSVFIVQDPFTSFYEAELVSACIDVIIALEKNPILLPFIPNGKPQHVKGFLKQFKSTAQNASKFLSSIQEHGIPMIGLDASLVMVYRDEYKTILGEERGEFEVLLAHEWFEKQNWQSIDIDSKNTGDYTLLSHCTETTALPNASKVWKNIFNNLGLNLNTPVTGCCGMSGTYGHELQNQKNSETLYHMSWEKHVKGTQPENLLSTGFSCRSQVKRYENKKPKHPIELLANRIKQ